MNQQKFLNGAFAFTRARGLEPRKPEELKPLAGKHGIEESIIPEYAGDRTAFGRAINQASKGLAREGFLLRPIKRSAREVVYGIVREDKDEAGERLNHEFKATVLWAAEPDPSLVSGSHPVARRVAQAYQALRGKITADDWSSVITSYLERNDAARVRSDGRVYWIPPQRIDTIRQLGAFLHEVGIDLVLCELEPEVRNVVQDVARENLDEQLDQLEAEAASFDGKQKPSTYVRRLETYQNLRSRAVLYRDALGVGVDRAQKVLSELEQKVSSMLDVRKQTVIHRNTTQHPTAKPAATLRFGGATFVLTKEEAEVTTFTSDSPTAQAALTTLENVGLAGKWQQAGRVQVSIHNSGPPGARVSIRLRLPEGQDLRAAANSLATVGIEVRQ